MPLNPSCSPGWAVRQADGRVTACCGCGWFEDGYPSKRQALKAQKAHRFPGPNPKKKEAARA